MTGPPPDAVPLEGRRADDCGSRLGRDTAVRPLELLLPPDDTEPPLDEEPPLLPPELEPPRDVALPPVDEPLPVGRRASWASAGVASASVISAVRETLVDARIAEPRAVNRATLLPEGFLKTTPNSSGFQGQPWPGRPAARTGLVLGRGQLHFPDARQ
jgi:hypothetical protein